MQSLDVVEVVDVVADGLFGSLDRHVEISWSTSSARSVAKKLSATALMLPAIAFPAHALGHVVLYKFRMVVGAGVRTATVGVVHQSAGDASARVDRALQSGQSELGIFRLAHRPTHHASRKQVDKHGEVGPAFVRCDVGYVTCPSLVRCGRLEVPSEHVSRWCARPFCEAHDGCADCHSACCCWCAPP